MRLGMMQPYFFLYAGYFSLIHATDQWVVFDSAQYIRRAWVNRNRIQCEGKDPWSYIRVPVEHAPRSTPISQIRIDQKQPWTDQLQGQLDVYRLRRAPFFSTVSDWLAIALDSAVTESSGQLSKLLIHLLESTTRSGVECFRRWLVPNPGTRLEHGNSSPSFLRSVSRGL